MTICSIGQERDVVVTLEYDVAFTSGRLAEKGNDNRRIG